MTSEKANQILSEISDFYTDQAVAFAQTREKAWPDGPVFAEYMPQTGKVLDVGCGSGRFAPLLAPAVQYTGIDMSKGIIDYARAQYNTENREFMVGSMVNLPFADATFDGIAMLASLHHVPSETLRKQAVSELFRVLKPGGTVIATVWNLCHEDWMTKFNLTETSFLGSDGFDPGDVLIPWKAGETQQNRYVHAFLPEELESLFVLAGFKDITIKNGLNLLILGKKY